MVGFGGGNDTVTIVHNAQTSTDYVGAGMITAQLTVITGCRHRALVPVAARGGGEARAEKTAEIGVGVATSWWQTTFPVTLDNSAAILAILPTDQLIVNGDTFQVISGIHKFTDASGAYRKVTVLSEKQEVG